MTAPRRDRFERLSRTEEPFPEYRGRPREVSDSGSALQRFTATATGLLWLTVLVALGLSAVTSAAAAQRIIARALPIITEGDQLLALHREELQSSAKASGGAPVPLPGFPIAVMLTAKEIETDSMPSLQLLVDERAAKTIYDRGIAAFAAGGGRSSHEAGPLLSGTWTLHKILSLLNAREHARFKRFSTMLGLLTVAMAALFCLQVRGYGRLVGLGAACLFGALVAALVTFFAWLAVQFFYSSATSPVSTAAWGMTADVTWTMVLVDGVAFLCAAATIVTGIAFAALDRNAEHVGRRPVRLEYRGRRFD